ncbi:unnamed protein product [Chrysoparadoxa australica]
MSKLCREFAKVLSNQVHVETKDGTVYLYDERFSTQSAEILQEEGFGKKTTSIDALAARIILEDYFDNNGKGAERVLHDPNVQKEWTRQTGETGSQRISEAMEARERAVYAATFLQEQADVARERAEERRAQKLAARQRLERRRNQLQSPLKRLLLPKTDELVPIRPPAYERLNPVNPNPLIEADQRRPGVSRGRYGSGRYYGPGSLTDAEYGIDRMMQPKDDPADVSRVDVPVRSEINTDGAWPR